MSDHMRRTVVGENSPAGQVGKQHPSGGAPRDRSPIIGSKTVTLTLTRAEADFVLGMTNREILDADTYKIDGRFSAVRKARSIQKKVLAALHE